MTRTICVFKKIIISRRILITLTISVQILNNSICNQLLIESLHATLLDKTIESLFPLEKKSKYLYSSFTRFFHSDFFDLVFFSYEINLRFSNKLSIFNRCCNILWVLLFCLDLVFDLIWYKPFKSGKIFVNIFLVYYSKNVEVKEIVSRV